MTDDGFEDCETSARHFLKSTKDGINCRSPRSWSDLICKKDRGSQVLLHFNSISSLQSGSFIVSSSFPMRRRHQVKLRHGVLRCLMLYMLSWSKRWSCSEKWSSSEVSMVMSLIICAVTIKRYSIAAACVVWGVVKGKKKIVRYGSVDKKYRGYRQLASSLF